VWSTADHLKRWFCPAGFSVPQAHVEFLVGGAFHIYMRSPKGKDSWIKGTFVEIVPHNRLVVDMTVVEMDVTLFRAYTVVTFSDEGDGSRMAVTQSYTLLEPLAARMIEGGTQGWEQILDRLASEVERVQRPA
jgi:uncharacterized protein YndB with AHSA1/START domain